ncbi:hypothetical protein ABZR88_07585 [Mucilaginibacter yixingensis]|nr:hypothetical protein [Mucilaginibacter yixingensis]
MATPDPEESNVFKTATTTSAQSIMHASQVLIYQAIAAITISIYFSIQ